MLRRSVRGCAWMWTWGGWVGGGKRRYTVVQAGGRASATGPSAPGRVRGGGTTGIRAGEVARVTDAPLRPSANDDWNVTVVCSLSAFTLRPRGDVATRVAPLRTPASGRWSSHSSHVTLASEPSKPHPALVPGISSEAQLHCVSTATRLANIQPVTPTRYTLGSCTPQTRGTQRERHTHKGFTRRLWRSACRALGV